MPACNGDTAGKAENEHGECQGRHDDHGDSGEGRVLPEAEPKSQQCFHHAPPKTSAHTGPHASAEASTFSETTETLAATVGMASHAVSRFSPRGSWLHIVLRGSIPACPIGLFLPRAHYCKRHRRLARARNGAFRVILPSRPRQSAFYFDRIPASKHGVPPCER